MAEAAPRMAVPVAPPVNLRDAFGRIVGEPGRSGEHRSRCPVWNQRDAGPKEGGEEKLSHVILRRLRLKVERASRSKIFRQLIPATAASACGLRLSGSLDRVPRPALTGINREAE
jgi:hypothetical protein